MTHFLIIIDCHSHCSEYKFASEDRKLKKIIKMMYLIFAMSICFTTCDKRIQHTIKRMNRQ